MTGTIGGLLMLKLPLMLYLHGSHPATGQDQVLILIDGSCPDIPTAVKGRGTWLRIDQTKFLPQYLYRAMQAFRSTSRTNYGSLPIQDAHLWLVRP